MDWLSALSVERIGFLEGEFRRCWDPVRDGQV